MSFPFLCTADTPIGRFHMDALTDQMRMELFVEPMLGEDRSIHSNEKRDKHGNFTDACHWVCVECNCNGDVLEIQFGHEQWLCGTVSLDFLPPKLRMFDIGQLKVAESRRIHGTVNAALLPRELALFDLCGNRFHGEIDFGDLPRSLQYLKLIDNNFSGTVDFGALPPALFELWIRRNNFSGSADLTNLPEALELADLSENNFMGTIDLSRLPEGLEALYLGRNGFAGEIEFSKLFDDLPETLEKLSLAFNSFTGNGRALAQAKWNGAASFDIRGNPIEISGVTTMPEWVNFECNEKRDNEQNRM